MIEALSGNSSILWPAVVEGPAAFTVLLLVKSSLIVAAGYAVARLLSGASASARHTAWSAVFAGLLLLPLLAGVGGWSLPIPMPHAMEPAPVTAGQSPSSVATGVGDPGRADGAPAGASPGAGHRTPAGESAQGGASGSAGWWVRAGVAIYAVGAALLLLRLATGLATVWWISRRGRRLTALPRWSELLRRAAGGESRVELVMSSRLRVPMVWGWRRPVVLLPAAAAEWSDRELSDALVHELAHVQRGDWLIQLASRLVCAMYWFHPLVWMARRHLVLEAERSCDDRVLAAGAETHGYAEQLVNLARVAAGLGADGAVTMARRTQLSGRISALLDRQRKRGPLGLLAAVALAVAALLPTLVLAPIELVASPQASAQRASRPEPSQGVAASARRVPDDALPASATPEAPLLRAASVGDAATVRRLLDAGANPDQREVGAGTPLIRAAAAGHREVVDVLLSEGADPRRLETARPRGDLPRSPLGAAALSGDVQIIESLLDAGAEVDMAPRGDATPLIIAAERGHSAAVDHLLSRGADANAVVKGDGSPLIAAARSGNLWVADSILDAGADVNLWVDGDESPLFHAVASGNADLVRDLLDRGADPNGIWPGAGSPLIVAMKAGHGDVVDELLAAGAEVDQGVRGDGSPLIAAAGRGDTESVWSLLDRGADIDQPVIGDGSALIAAARSGNLEVVELLVNQGATIDQVVPGDENALIGAAWAGHLEVVRFLLERNADPNIRVLANPGPRQEVRTALRMARRGGHDDVVELLLAYGAVDE